jgi:shikimate dehydrogenase
MPYADRCAVIGHPIAHSKSPVIHKLFAEQTGQKIEYEALDVAPEDLDKCIRQFLAAGGHGLNVTVPHKQSVLPLLDELTDRAKLAGAVNTMTQNEDGTLSGDNTDGAGLIADLQTNLGYEIKGSNILVLGAGGATRGILPPLLDQRPDSLLIANRTVERAQQLVEDFATHGKLHACGFDELENRDFDLILNATSAGLEGNLPPFPPSIIGPESVCYDLSYSMRETPFVSWAKGLGCRHVHEGWGMLVEQAAESFTLWRGVRPNTQAVLSRLP